MQPQNEDKTAPKAKQAVVWFPGRPSVKVSKYCLLQQDRVMHQLLNFLGCLRKADKFCKEREAWYL
jgi:hypothetical protein